jgi:hypothetical protein
VNVKPGPGEALSVTGVPCAKGAEQTEPQPIPAGWLETVPVPIFETVTVCALGGGF